MANPSLTLPLCILVILIGIDLLQPIAPLDPEEGRKGSKQFNQWIPKLSCFRFGLKSRAIDRRVHRG
jgi:hypothetical protein